MDTRGRRRSRRTGAAAGLSGADRPAARTAGCRRNASLCDALGVSRGDLRKALAVLETRRPHLASCRQGHFRRQRPGRGDDRHFRDRRLHQPGRRDAGAADHRAGRSRARRRCTRRATTSRRCASRCTRRGEAATWRQYENFDNLLHRQIAQASCNTVLLGLFDVLNAVRRTVVWGRLRPDSARPPADHHSFADHERIVESDRRARPRRRRGGHAPSSPAGGPAPHPASRSRRVGPALRSGACPCGAAARACSGDCPRCRRRRRTCRPSECPLAHR